MFPKPNVNVNYDKQATDWWNFFMHVNAAKGMWRRGGQTVLHVKQLPWRCIHTTDCLVFHAWQAPKRLVHVAPPIISVAVIGVCLRKCLAVAIKLKLSLAKSQLGLWHPFGPTRLNIENIHFLDINQTWNLQEDLTSPQIKSATSNETTKPS